MASIQTQLNQSRGARCPLCFEELGQVELISLKCEGCQTSVHALCFEEFGLCPTLACVPYERPAEARRARPLGTRVALMAFEILACLALEALVSLGLFIIALGLIGEALRPGEGRWLTSLHGLIPLALSCLPHMIAALIDHFKTAESEGIQSWSFKNPDSGPPP